MKASLNGKPRKLKKTDEVKSKRRIVKKEGPKFYLLLKHQYGS